MKLHLVLFISGVLCSVVTGQIYLLPATYSADLQDFYVTLQKNSSAPQYSNEAIEELSLPEEIDGTDPASDENQSNVEIPPTDKFEGLGRQARQCSRCSCGIPNNNRIIGGTEVHYNKYPWMAQLLNNNNFFCGGALINNLYILTAAHCAQGVRAETITVRLLEFNRTKSNGILRRVSKSIVHKGYNPYTVNNDIALLKLSEPVPITGIIRPICLSNEPTRTFSGHVGTVAGWGVTKTNGRPSNILREVRVPILSNEACRKTVYGSKITKQMLCAGYAAGKLDACQGDSGGPLMVHSKGAFEQPGIVSFGNGCALPNSPGVYTRVTEFRKWILENTKDACYCNHRGN